MRYDMDCEKGIPYQRATLWENRSPTSAISGRTDITLSDSLSNYDIIEIKFRISTSDATIGSVQYSVSEFKQYYYTGTNSIILPFVGCAINTNGYSRDFTYISDTVIAIYSAYLVGSSSSANSYLIPLKIIGIKKGLGETAPKIKEGTFTASAVGDLEVTVGFKPRLLYVTHFTSTSTSDFSVGEGIYVYDEDFNSGVANRGLTISSGDYLDRNVLPYTGTYQVIKSITDTGFVMYINANTFYGTYKYIAIE